jgi:hypothetical protein
MDIFCEELLGPIVRKFELAGNTLPTTERFSEGSLDPSLTVKRFSHKRKNEYSEEQMKVAKNLLGSSSPNSSFPPTSSPFSSPIRDHLQSKKLKQSNNSGSRHDKNSSDDDTPEQPRLPVGNKLNDLGLFPCNHQ